MRIRPARSEELPALLEQLAKPARARGLAALTLGLLDTGHSRWMIPRGRRP